MLSAFSFFTHVTGGYNSKVDIVILTMVSSKRVEMSWYRTKGYRQTIGAIRSLHAGVVPDSAIRLKRSVRRSQSVCDTNVGADIIF